MPDVPRDRPLDLGPHVLALAKSQDGVVGRDQLAALGVDRHRLRDQVRARRWRLVGRAVVTHRGPLTRRQRWWIAILHVGQGSALASLSALEAIGLTGWEPEQVHVVVANGARVHPLSWMRIHVSRRFKVSDVDPMSSPPRCTVARAAVDAASWKPKPRVGCAILAAAVQQGLVTPSRLDEQIHASGAIRHRRILLAALADIEGGSHALAEIDLIRLCGRAGLPKPQQQVVRRDSSGRRRYLDARLVRPDGRVILIEVDGAVHLNVAHWWDDQLRSNDLVITDDAIIIRIPAVILRTDQQLVIAHLKRAYFGPAEVARQSGRHSARPA